MRPFTPRTPSLSIMMVVQSGVSNNDPKHTSKVVKEWLNQEETVLKKQDHATKLTNVVELHHFCKKGLVNNSAGGLQEALQIWSFFQKG